MQARLTTAVLLIAALSAPPAAADFSMNATLEDVRHAAGFILVKDLVVGDQAIIARSPCNYDGRVFLDGLLRISDARSEYSHQILATKMPAGVFSLTVAISGRDNRGIVEYILDLLEAIADTDCAHIQDTPDRYFPVSDIFGATDARSLFPKSGRTPEATDAGSAQ